jgi:hypothetical protein
MRKYRYSNKVGGPAAQAMWAREEALGIRDGERTRLLTQEEETELADLLEAAMDELDAERRK